MRLRVFTRPLTAAGLVLLAAASTPAFGQTADVAVTLTLGGESAVSTAGITLGGTETYKVSLHNAGPSHVTAYVVDASFTAPAAPYNAAIKVTPPASCVPTGATDFPCKVTLAAPLVSGADTSVSISIEVPAPDTAPTAPANCPTAMEAATPGSTDIVATVSVPLVLQGATDVDPSYLNNSPAPIHTKLRPWADLSVESLDGPANASEGQQITYTEVVKNNGPCAAQNVFVDFFPPGSLTFVSASGCDNNATFGPADDSGCDFSGAQNPIAAGVSKTFSAIFSVNTFPKSVIKAALPVATDLLSVSPSASVAATDDPYQDNNSGATSATVDLSKNDSGCSTGGAGTLLGLLSLLALRFARRRAS
jgi:uncharacterized repeat protein (TIGR01451 family)